MFSAPRGLIFLLKTAVPAGGEALVFLFPLRPDV